MRRLLPALILMVVASTAAQPAFAIKQLNDQFKKLYAGEDANEEFKAKVAEAKCNVCHINRESKKKRNPYGAAMHEALEKAEFPIKEFKKDPEKYADEVKKILEKVAGEKTGDEKYETFAARMKANLLPGGNKDGKQD